MGGRPPRLLVTGFGPFPGVPDNPSAWLVEELAASALAEEIEAQALHWVLPTDWVAAPDAYRRLWEAHRPDIAVQFGVSRRACDFQLERIARNRMADDKPDASGARAPSSRIDADGPESWRGSLPIRRIRASLESAGHPASLSEDAGTYLCNALYYRAGRLAASSGRLVMAGFVHLPFLADAVPEEAVAASAAAGEEIGVMAPEAMRAGASLLLSLAVAAWRERAEGEGA
ncbi:pyroglutamyl-peptidase I [Afifella pfennigii]|uniref:pyroglutamyl-peptidase I n=1 Tax=Afifella pfennigii TaxID=209897 RepID=UPI00047B5FA9|nr:pyroglutamyl-peptidase I [Afifella pfennigii]